MAEIEDEPMKERVRQSERTVDNLKRLYAVLFALSFGVLAASTVSKLTGALDASAISAGSLWLHVETAAIFAVTAGLFYYQSDRILDVTLAKSPLPDVSWRLFAFTYLVNVFTMAPFYLMATALSKPYTDAHGFTWYFLSYLILMANGLFWLLLREGLNRLLHRPSQTGDGLWPQAKAVEALNAFWLLMNSGLLLLLLLIYVAFRQGGAPCPANGHGIDGVAFITLLCALILVRDILDYAHGWPVLYPVRDPAAEIKARPLLFALQAPRARAWALGVSILLVVSSTLVVLATRLWDLGALRQACAI